MKTALVLILLCWSMGMGYAELSGKTHILGIDIGAAEIFWTGVLGLVCVALLSKIEIRKRREECESCGP